MGKGTNLLGIAAIAALSTVSCGGATPADPDAQRTIDSLCTVREQAQIDPAGAQALFHATAHPAIGALATDLGATDRARSARLLEAISDVTATFEPGAMTTRFEPTLDELTNLTRSAYDSHGKPTHPC